MTEISNYFPTAEPMTEADLKRHVAAVVASYEVTQDSVLHKLIDGEGYLPLRPGYKGPAFKAVDMNDAEELAKAQTYFSELAEHADGDAAARLGALATLVGTAKTLITGGKKSPIALIKGFTALKLLDRVHRADVRRQQKELEALYQNEQRQIGTQFRRAMQRLA